MDSNSYLLMAVFVGVAAVIFGWPMIRWVIRRRRARKGGGCKKKAKVSHLTFSAADLRSQAFLYDQGMTNEFGGLSSENRKEAPAKSPLGDGEGVDGGQDTRTPFDIEARQEDWWRPALLHCSTILDDRGRWESTAPGAKAYVNHVKPEQIAKWLRCFAEGGKGVAKSSYMRQVLEDTAFHGLLRAVLHARSYLVPGGGGEALAGALITAGEIFRLQLVEMGVDIQRLALPCKVSPERHELVGEDERNVHSLPYVKEAVLGKISTFGAHDYIAVDCLIFGYKDQVIGTQRKSRIVYYNPSEWS